LGIDTRKLKRISGNFDADPEIKRKIRKFGGYKRICSSKTFACDAKKEDFWLKDLPKISKFLPAAQKWMKAGFSLILPRSPGSSQICGFDATLLAQTPSDPPKSLNNAHTTPLNPSNGPISFLPHKSGISEDLEANI